MLQGGEDAPGPLAAATHLCASFSATILSSPEEAQAHVDEAIRLYRDSGDQRGLVTGLFGKGNVALRIGDFNTAIDCSQEALGLCDEIGDRWGRAGPLSVLSLVYLFGGGSLDDARRLAERAVALYRELDDTGSLVVMNPLSVIALRQGDLVAAEKYALDAAAIAAGTGWEATALVNMGEVLLAKGDADGAGITLQRGLLRALDTGLENWFRIALRDLSRVAALNDEPRRAAVLLGASRRNMPQYGLDPDVYESVETACRKVLDEDAFSRATEEGYQMDHAQLLLVLEDT
jgi:tetratricopeptide (TPR) repeat protein